MPPFDLWKNIRTWIVEVGKSKLAGRRTRFAFQVEEMQMSTCIKCGNEFEPGHRGYANRCYDCSFKQKPTEEQRQTWNTTIDVED
jgi:DNA-directed RNA polymerase subunit RPC12/RpoP